MKCQVKGFSGNNVYSSKSCLLCFHDHLCLALYLCPFVSEVIMSGTVVVFPDTVWTELWGEWGAQLLCYFLCWFHKRLYIDPLLIKQLLLSFYVIMAVSILDCCL